MDKQHFQNEREKAIQGIAKSVYESLVHEHSGRSDHLVKEFSAKYDRGQLMKDLLTGASSSVHAAHVARKYSDRFHKWLWDRAIKASKEAYGDKD